MTTAGHHTPSSDPPGGPTADRPTTSAAVHTRKLTIVAKDPGVTMDDGVVFAQVDVPAEHLTFGPTGYRIKVVDYNATEQQLYKSRVRYESKTGFFDPFDLSKHAKEKLLADPNFHAQNAYAIAMRTLARFEYALGRRVSWGFNGHQLHIAPHGFCNANAFYSEADRGLFFGYFWGKTGKLVFTSLSHDIVAHETTHALLDGLRDRFSEPATPDQMSFHEAFADIVALLSVYALPEVVATILGFDVRQQNSGKKIREIAANKLTVKALAKSIVSGVAMQFGGELPGFRGDSLRQSAALEPSTDYLKSEKYQEAHTRGEILVAAMMRTFLNLWHRRIETLGTFGGDHYNVDRVVEDGAKVADHLLTMAIRAIDYCPPTDVDFGTYLSALLTVDAEVVPDDTRFGYRKMLRKTFASYGITTAADSRSNADGTWRRFDPLTPLTYARSNFDSMMHDRDEVFRFLWDNQAALEIENQSYIEVDSVRPSVRLGPDGFFMRETVCTYTLTAQFFESETPKYLGFKIPKDLQQGRSITAYGGGVVIFDQYGQVKYHIANPLKDPERQKRLVLGERTGSLPAETALEGTNRFAIMHGMRSGAL